MGVFVSSLSSSPAAPSTSEGAGQERAAARTVSLPHLGGLDGLRAFAVIAVVVYHVLPPALGGGFIGVDVFFVISGFLITSLLLHEYRSTGTVRRGRFWMRRVRRLAPALVLMLLVCTAAAGVIGGDVLVGIGWQLLGGVTFGFNWLAIVNGSSYFASTAPELYRNLWSLAVEEQFYLIWPLALVLLFFVRPVMRVFIVAALAAASALAMLVLLQDGSDPTRVYFGTDTHSFGLLLGAALAFGLAARRPRLPTAPGLVARLGLSAAAIVLVLGLVAAAVLLREDEPATYRGGLLAVTVVTTLLIWVLTRAPWVGQWLDIAPLRYIGRRSYGIYLWHWPVLVLVAAVAPHLRPGTPPYLAVAVMCLVLTGLASVLSYRWLEVPIRTLGFRGWLRRLGTSVRRGPAVRRLAIVVAPVFVVALLAGSASAVASAPEQSSSERAIARGQQALAQASPTPSATPTASPSPSAPAPEAPPAVTPEPAPPPPPAPPPTAPPSGDLVSAIGDSVMLAAAPELQAALPGIAIDAVVSRQTTEGAGVVQALADQGLLRQYVVVALGTNGDCADRHFQQIVDAAGPSREVVFVNVSGPMSWGATVNERLLRIAAANPNVTIADWATAIAPSPDLLAGDGIHPQAGGGAIYSGAVVASLAAAAG